MEFSFFDFNVDNQIHFNIDVTESPILYHYTDYAGVKGILESGCFWVSRYDALKDLAETNYIKVILKSVCEIIMDDLNRYKNMNFDLNGLLLNDLIKYINHLGDVFSISASDFNLYILSLSENVDSLFLFSSYSSNEGYNIGVDLNKYRP